MKKNIAMDNPQQIKAQPPTTCVRLVHISDTHNLHWQLDSGQPGTANYMPDGDILLHTGDFTNDGTPQEVSDFNDWLGLQRRRYKHIVVIPGNHEYRYWLDLVSKQQIPASALLAPDLFKSALTNATHVLHHEEIVLEGIRIWGSPWEPWHASNHPENGFSPGLKGYVWAARTAVEGPDCDATRFDLIPDDIDIVMTHGPPRHILDCIGHQNFYGSSSILREALKRSRAKAHFFGHLHEQRGVYWRHPTIHEGRKFVGGVEYEIGPGRSGPFETIFPQLQGHPCQLFSNNAMCNHRHLEGVTQNSLAGLPRVILASRSSVANTPNSATGLSAPEVAATHLAPVAESPSESPGAGRESEKSGSVSSTVQLPPWEFYLPHMVERIQLGYPHQVHLAV